MKRSLFLNPAFLATVLFGAAGALAGTLYVDLNSANPQAPFADWSTAARSIQDAVDAAAASDTIVVTNGIYATGGRTMSDTTTNRVAIDKVVTVVSVNGPQFTVIQGYQVPGTTNGAQAVRCVDLANGATLAGFTLTKGATISSGGGVKCESVSAVVSNCVIVGNAASFYGGGVFSGTIIDCTLNGNAAISIGGGAMAGTLSNCALSGNSATRGGGAALCTLNNCTLTGNTAIGPTNVSGGGAWSCTLNNSIIYHNQLFSFLSDPETNYDSGSVLNYCCTTPLPFTGTGNIASDPQLASLSHISATSPCRAAGSVAYASGTDIDGEAWRNPPAIGCDEYRAGAVTGPLSVSIAATSTNLPGGGPVGLTALIGGRVTASEWDFGDGIVLRDQPNTSHAWMANGDYGVVLRAYNESNPAGVSATVMVHVQAVTNGVFMPESSPLGKTYAEWSAAWWQWNFSLPMTNSPVQDTAPISTRQSGPVWFLAGTFGQGGNLSRVRSGSVPENTALFVPLGESWADNAGCPPTAYTTSQLRALAASVQNLFLGMSCTIDGKPTVDLSAPNSTPYRVQSPVFTYTMPAVHNYAYDIFGATCYFNTTGTPYTIPGAVADGVYLIVAPLPPGAHTIHFSATYYDPNNPPAVVQNITYNLTVVPTPSLAVSHQGTSLVLSWPQAASWYVLETTTNFTSPNWVGAGVPIQQVGSLFRATIPTGSGSQFFRLRRN